MWCRLSAMPGCAAEHSVLCEKCCVIDTAKAKAGWIVGGQQAQPEDLHRCEGNPDLRCVWCNYQPRKPLESAPSLPGSSLPAPTEGRAASRDRLWTARSLVDAADDEKQRTYGERAREFARKAMDRKASNADQADVKMAQLVSGLQLLAVDLGFVWDDVLLTANAMTQRVEQAERKARG
jgi:hypothetical protein